MGRAARETAGIRGLLVSRQWRPKVKITATQVGEIYRETDWSAATLDLWWSHQRECQMLLDLVRIVPQHFKSPEDIDGEFEAICEMLSPYKEAFSEGWNCPPVISSLRRDHDRMAKLLREFATNKKKAERRTKLAELVAAEKKEHDDAVKKRQAEKMQAQEKRESEALCMKLQGLTLDEISKRLSVSKNRASQIVNAAADKAIAYDRFAAFLYDILPKEMQRDVMLRMIAA